LRDNEKKPFKVIEGGRPLSTDDTPRYVRVNERDKKGWVHFDFAMGSPDLFVELVLPEEAFLQFCETNKVTHMTEEQSQMVEDELVRWRYGEDGLRRRREEAASEEND